MNAPHHALSEDDAALRALMAEVGDWASLTFPNDPASILGHLQDELVEVGEPTSPDNLREELCDVALILSHYGRVMGDRVTALSDGDRPAPLVDLALTNFDEGQGGLKAKQLPCLFFAAGQLAMANERSSRSAQEALDAYVLAGSALFRAATSYAEAGGTALAADMRAKYERAQRRTYVVDERGIAHHVTEEP